VSGVNLEQDGHVGGAGVVVDNHLIASLHGDKVADVQAIRAHFPALARTHAGAPVAFFDAPGGTQVPRAVPEAMADYLLHHNANSHWAYPTSEETDAVIVAARAAAADFVGGAPDEVAFGANMTTLTFHLARALARGWKAGDELVVTELDHHANVDAWKHVARDRGLVVRTVAAQGDAGTLDLDDLARQVGPRTRLVAVGAASNALGTVTRVPEVARIAHAHGALCFVDAVHSAAHLVTDVAWMECDFLACSPYKFYGPHQGILWGRRALLERLDVPKVQPAPEAAPDRLELGTPSFEAMAGTTAAIDFLAGLAVMVGTRRARLEATMGALHVRGVALVAQMLDGLRGIPGVRVFGPPAGVLRTPTVSFAVGTRPARDVARALAARGVFASSGNFYASTIVAKLGYGGTGLVRAGAACYTTSDEVTRLVDAVAEVAGGR
jgi:cysteine desulfurase family protein (TIGR01976 family)